MTTTKSMTAVLYKILGLSLLRDALRPMPTLRAPDSSTTILRGTLRNRSRHGLKFPGCWAPIAALLLCFSMNAQAPAFTVDAVRAAYRMVNGTTDGFDAQQVHASTSDRIDAQPIRTIDDSRRMVEALRSDRRLAQKILAAHYGYTFQVAE